MAGTQTLMNFFGDSVSHDLHVELILAFDGSEVLGCFYLNLISPRSGAPA